MVIYIVAQTAGQRSGSVAHRQNLMITILSTSKRRIFGFKCASFLPVVLVALAVWLAAVRRCLLLLLRRKAQALCDTLLEREEFKLHGWHLLQQWQSTMCPLLARVMATTWPANDDSGGIWLICVAAHKHSIGFIHCRAKWPGKWPVPGFLLLLLVRYEPFAPRFGNGQ